MIIGVPKDNKSKPAESPEDGIHSSDVPGEKTDDRIAGVGPGPGGAPEISRPAEAPPPRGIRLRAAPDGGGNSAASRRLMEHDKWTRERLGSAQYEIRRALGPSATLRGVAAELAEANHWRGIGQWEKDLLQTHAGIASSVREFAGLQLPNFTELELMKSAAAAVADGAGVRDGLMKTFQDVQICLGHYDRVMPGPFLGVGPGSSIQRQRSFIESLFGDGDYGIQWAVREAEQARRLLGGLQGHAEWSLIRDSLEIMRGLPRDFDLASMRRIQDGFIEERWIGPARNLGGFLPVPSARPEPGADWLAEDQPAPCADAPGSAIVAPGSTNLDRAVFLEIAQQCGWNPDRLLRVLAEMRGARVEMARPAPEREEPRAPIKSRRSRSGGVRGGVVIRDQGGAFEIGFRGEVRQFGKLKGLEILKTLTDHPDQFFSCLDLRHDSAAATVPRVFVGENEAAARRYGLAEGYDRVKELAGEIEEADARSDWRMKAKLEEQQDELIRQFMVEKGERGAVPGPRLPGLGPRGKGGKGRLKKRVSPELDRARKAVSAAVQYAYGVIGKELPDLEEHLRGRVDTGFYCRYRKIGEKP